MDPDAALQFALIFLGVLAAGIIVAAIVVFADFLADIWIKTIERADDPEYCSTCAGPCRDEGPW